MPSPASSTSSPSRTSTASASAPTAASRTSPAGDQYSANAMWGKTFDKGNILVSGRLFRAEPADPGAAQGSVLPATVPLQAGRQPRRPDRPEHRHLQVLQLDGRVPGRCVRQHLRQYLLLQERLQRSERLPQLYLL
ncbi:MAG: hypothetical protein WDN06_09945 [Asticcacaulis sp.]